MWWEEKCFVSKCKVSQENAKALKYIFFSSIWLYCIIYHHYVPVGQWSQTQFLEGHSSAEFSSNQLKITLALKFLVILKTLISWIRCVCLGLEQNCAELWLSMIRVWDQCYRGSIENQLYLSNFAYQVSVSWFKIFRHLYCKKRTLRKNIFFCSNKIGCRWPLDGAVKQPTVVCLYKTL